LEGLGNADGVARSNAGAGGEDRGQLDRRAIGRRDRLTQPHGAGQHRDGAIERHGRVGHPPELEPITPETVRISIYKFFLEALSSR